MVKRTEVIALLICLSGFIVNPAMARPGQTGGALPDNSTEKLSQPSTTSNQPTPSLSDETAK